MASHVLCILTAVLTIPALADVVPFGVCAHLGGGGEFEDREQELQLMQDAGIRWARADFTWGVFEPQNDRWSFDRYDQLMVSAKSHNVNLLPILCYNVDWAYPAHEHLDDWCDYVRHVVERYKGDIKHWEVWNEPNIGFWRPEPDPEQYAALLIASYETIKQTDPEAQVVYGGTAGIPFEYIRKTFEYGAFEAFDVMAVHPYRYPQVPEKARILEDLQATWALMEEYGGGKDLWITEFGWPTHTNPLLDEGGFATGLILRAATLRFPQRTEFEVAVLDETGLPGCETLGPRICGLLDQLANVSARLVGLAGLEALDASTTQVLVMPTGEHYPADYFDEMVRFVREGGLLVHMGGVPFYYAQRLKDGEWEGPHAPEAAREALHVGWKAWWIEEGLPQEASRTELVGPHAEGLNLPPKVKSTRWLTDTRLQGEDRFIRLLAGYNDDELIGYPVALYLHDSELKGGFLGMVLSFTGSGVTDDIQALYLPRAYLLTLGEGLQNVFWYEFRDGGNDATYNEHRFGVIRNDLSPKPAYRAYATLTRALGEGRLLEKREVGEGSYCYLFDAGETLTAAIWRAEGEAAVSIDANGTPTACDYLGEPVELVVKAGKITVTARPEVTYVTGIGK